MKWLKITLIVQPVLLILAVLIVFWRLDSIVRSTVETEASTGLNVPATLADADVAVFGGTVQLRDFALASPKGFPAPKMFELGGIDVAASYRQLWDKPIRVTSIRIDRPMLLIERKDLTLNVKALIDGLPVDDAPTKDEAETVRLIIDQLSVVDARVVVRPGIPGVEEQLELTVPTFQVKNIGNADGAQNGAAVREVVLTVIAALAQAASESDRLPAELRAILKGDIEQLVATKIANVRGELDKAVETIKADPTKIKDVGDQLKKGIEDALKK